MSVIIRIVKPEEGNDRPNTQKEKEKWESLAVPQGYTLPGKFLMIPSRLFEAIDEGLGWRK